MFHPMGGRGKSKQWNIKLRKSAFYNSLYETTSGGGARINATTDEYSHETHEKTRKLIFILVQLTGANDLH